MPFQNLRSEGKEWLKANKERLWLFIGILFALGIAFQAGRLQGVSFQQEPLIITIPETTVVSAVETKNEEVASNQASNQPLSKNCVFVGSRNSNKYHLPSCASAKRIKPENVVCFASQEDAAARGYVAGCLK